MPKISCVWHIKVFEKRKKGLEEVKEEMHMYIIIYRSGCEE